MIEFNIVAPEILTDYNVALSASYVKKQRVTTGTYLSEEG